VALEDVANEAAKIAAALCAHLVHRVGAKHPITFELRFGEELVRGANAAVCAPAFIKLKGIGQSYSREGIQLDDVYLEQFQRDDNAQVFAAAYTGFFKAAYEPCLFVSLSDKRTPENRQHVIDLFSQRLQPALAQDPKEYSCRWVLHLMLISKNQK
jgi:hypothetical protein